jgi:L-rhamnose mutarotase
MFDNTKPNIILLSDKTDSVEMNRTLGVHKLAYCLRDAGYEVAVIHFLSVFTVEEIKHTLRHLISDKTLFVGVSNYFYLPVDSVEVDQSGSIEFKKTQPGCIIPHGMQFNEPIKQLIKELNPNCQLVVGGPSALDTEYNKIFDYVVLGYAEMSAVHLANYLKNPSTELPITNYQSVHGPIIVDDSKAVGYNFSSSYMDFDNKDAILPGETLLLEIGRGCIFKCAFCSHPLNGKKKLDYIRDHDSIRKELMTNYERFGTTNYIIIDDTFNDSVEKCKQFYDMTQTLPFKINWWGYIRLDLMAAHPETVEYLFESGLRAAFFGIETLNPKVGAKIGKGGTRDKLFSTARYIKDKYGDRVNLHGSFIFGLPHESLDSMRESARFLLSNDNPLDSWMLQVCRINSQDINDAFASDMDVNYQKYGYINLDEVNQQETPPGWESGNADGGVTWKPVLLKGMNWKNEYTSRDEVEALVSEIYKNKNDKLHGSVSFNIASLGIPIDTVLNKKMHEHNWYAYDFLKLKRGQQYKKLLYSKLGIPEFLSKLPGIRTYSELLKSGLLIKES